MDRLYETTVFRYWTVGSTGLLSARKGNKWSDFDFLLEAWKKEKQPPKSMEDMLIWEDRDDPLSDIFPKMSTKSQETLPFSLMSLQPKSYACYLGECDGIEVIV